MKNRTERAQELFDSGYNCAQAVFGAFCEELGIDLETAMRLMSSFGGGFGGLQEVCGAVSGISAAAGLAFASSDPSDKNAKARHYALIRKMAKEFEEQNGSLICRELLAGLKGKPAPKDGRRPCSVFVRSAVQILEDELRSAQESKA